MKTIITLKGGSIIKDYNKINIEILKIELKRELIKKYELDGKKYNKIFRFSRFVSVLLFLTQLIFTIFYLTSYSKLASSSILIDNKLIMIFSYLVVISFMVALVSYIFLQIIINHIRVHKVKLKLLTSIVYNQ